MVRAKFTVASIERTMGSGPKLDAEGNRVQENGRDVWEPCEMWTVKLSPVYANNDPQHENSKFWGASPSGSIALGTVNKAAVDQFDLGKEFYVDFHEAK